MKNVAYYPDILAMEKGFENEADMIKSEQEVEIESELEKEIRKQLAELTEKRLGKRWGNNELSVTGNGKENLVANEIERLRILGESFEGMFLVNDNEGFPIFPTVSFDEETSIARIVKLGPDKPWQYYLDKGYTVEKVTITIKKERR